jgi:hypothetical protein
MDEDIRRRHPCTQRNEGPVADAEVFGRPHSTAEREREHAREHESHDSRFDDFGSRQCKDHAPEE